MQKTLFLRILYISFIILLITGVAFLNLLGYVGNEYQSQRHINTVLDRPTLLVQEPNNPDYLYIAEQEGTILKVDNQRGAKDSEVFLNLTDRVVVTNEDGLLGMAFHPDYPETSKFYTFHSELNETCSDGEVCILTIISAFNVTNGKVDKDSQVELIVNYQNALYHRGGMINFGVDNLLYIHIGDGSFERRAQNTTNFFGSILRVDVDNPINESIPYGIPADNPFVDNPRVLDEIYAYGVRNPFRGDIDRKTGDYWFGDVGNARREEANKLEAGGNFEWPFYEGNLCRKCENDTRWNTPLIDYIHPESGNEELGLQFEFQNLNDPYGIAITGTTIYRGSAFNDLEGKLLMTDFLGMVFSVDTDDMSTELVTRIPNVVSAVWQDVETNEPYFVGLGVGIDKGVIYTLARTIPIYLVSSIIVISILILIPLIIRQHILKKAATN